MPMAQNSTNLQQFLDQQQYSRESVKRYEWIFGETYLSTGGEETTKKFVERLNLKPGEKILDVGSGTGGHDFFMAENYDVTVHGVDLSVNMMSIAEEHLSRRPHLKSKVNFEICDVTKKNFAEGSFDVIYSRDALLHIGDKENLFIKLLKYLKPGGRLLFTDYSKGDKEHSEEFNNYVAQRGYHLLTVKDYDKLLRKVGFVNVYTENQTSEFLHALEKELYKLKTGKKDFLKAFSEEDYKYLEDGWLSKIKRAKDGDQTWTLCYGEKQCV